MSKLSVFYVISLLILGLFVIFAIFNPMVAGEKYTEIQRESLLKTDDGWATQINLINNEGKDQNYTIHASVNDGKKYEEDILVKDGRTYTFVYRVSSKDLTSVEDKVKLVVYKEGESSPVEETTYYLD